MRERISIDSLLGEGADPADFIEGTFGDQIEVIKRLPVGKEISIISIDSKTDTRVIRAYVERLREQGLDIGKGDCELGYRMPLPNKQDQKRPLIVFRRYEQEIKGR